MSLSARDRLEQFTVRRAITLDFAPPKFRNYSKNTKLAFKGFKAFLVPMRRVSRLSSTPVGKISLIAVISGLTCKRSERVNSALS